MDNTLLGTQNRKRIYLMRHGDVRYVTPDGERVAEPDDVNLTDYGHEQARHMAEVLRDARLDRIICTSLHRTQQTAAPSLAQRHMEMEIYPDFREIKGGGLYPETPPGELPERLYILERATDPETRWNGGERISDFRDRVVGAIKNLLLEPGWNSLLLVAHGITNRAILSWVTRGGLAGMGCYEQDTACLNVFDADVVDGCIERRFIRGINMTPDNLTKHGRYQTSMEMGYTEWLQKQQTG